MRSKEEKIRRRDERLLKNEKSWRRARIGAICLAIIHIVCLLILKAHPLQEGSKEGFFVLLGWAVFWMLIVSWLNLRLGHIDSIKVYRNEKEAAEQI